jgi:hypothetical protein
MKKRGIFILVSWSVLSLLINLPVYGEDKQDEVYVIKKGDTLWDLSGDYLKDPYQWPELWQRNQYITNPHLIFPGNSLRLYGRPTDVRPETAREAEKIGGVVTEGEAISEGAETGEPRGVTEESVVAEETEKKPSGEEIEEARRIEEGEVEQELPSGEEEIVQVFRKGDIEYLILEEESLGRIIDARYEKRLLSQGDMVYLALKERPAEVGERFMIFRTRQMLKNPYTKQKAKKVYLLGALEITAVKGVLYQAEITDSLDAILRGDEIMTYRTVQ